MDEAGISGANVDFQKLHTETLSFNSVSLLTGLIKISFYLDRSLNSEIIFKIEWNQKQNQRHQMHLKLQVDPVVETAWCCVQDTSHEPATCTHLEAGVVAVVMFTQQQVCEAEMKVLEVKLIPRTLNTTWTDRASTVSQVRGFFFFERSVSSVLVWPQTSFSMTALTSSPERRTGGDPQVREPPDWLSGTPRPSCEPPELWWCRRPAAAPTSSSSGPCPSSDPSDPETRHKVSVWATETKTGHLINQWSDCKGQDTHNNYKCDLIVTSDWSKLDRVCSSPGLLVLTVGRGHC